MPEEKIIFDFDHPSPERTLYFPEGRGAGEDVILPDNMHLVGRDQPASKRWRGHVGTFIAEQTGRDLRKAWHVDDWPTGYSLWRRTRNTTSRSRKSSAPRYDFYLFGYGKKQRFESPQEFAFHAAWLYDDEYFLNGDCECTICTKRPQSEINEKWQSSLLPMRRAPARRAQLRHEQRDSSSPEPTNLPSDPGPSNRGRFFAWNRTSKLYHGSNSPAIPSQDPYRVGDMVWASIPPITERRGSPDSMTVIDFWPAVVLRRGVSIGQLIIQTSVDTIRLQYTHVWVRLLGVGGTHEMNDATIIPWHAFRYLGDFRRRVRDANMPVAVSTSLREIAGFHPLLTDSAEPIDPTIPTILRTFENALGPLGVAIREARLIGDQFTADPDYQQLWLGPQLICVGDLVRINVSRADLLEENANLELLPPREGSEQPGLLAHISAFQPPSSHSPDTDGEDHLTFTAHLYELEQSPGAEPTAKGESPSNSTLPNAPDGYRFRQITQEEVRLSVVYIAGRFAPILLTSTTHMTLLSRPLHTPGRISEETTERLRSLAGLQTPNPGTTTFASHWVRNRDAGLAQAERQAKAEAYERAANVGNTVEED
ncbi:hypothetical protein FRB99_003950 [Tulasnella sp. 403]|nr:hypothetical protein FRB99_003950 [Tulasnella sp. 403]